MKPNLSVCYILKNEEKTIRQSLESIKELAGQIVVVDTGCTDKTIDICKEFNCDIFKYELHNLPFTKGGQACLNAYGRQGGFNFSAARNFGISKCIQPYILILDGDEYFFDHAQLKSLISENPDIDIFELIQVNYNSCSMTKQFRLFKNFGGIKYEGAVHETLALSPGLPDEERYRIMQTDLTIIHAGKQLGRTDFENKMQSIIDSVACDNEIKKKYYWGIYYLKSGNHVQALQYLNECVFSLNVSLRAFVYLQVGKLYMQISRMYEQQALLNYSKALELAPNQNSVHWEMYEYYIFHNEVEKAKKEIEYIYNRDQIETDLQNDMILEKTKLETIIKNLNPEHDSGSIKNLNPDSPLANDSGLKICLPSRRHGRFKNDFTKSF